jgi:hypothetical protein
MRRVNRKAKVQQSVYLRKDIRLADNTWASTWTEECEEGYFQYKTRAYTLWHDIKSRTSCGSKLQDKSPCYKGSLSKFDCFQEFAEWCNNEYGYMETEENGKFWCIDKDILSKDKIYSKETCIFVPAYVNLLFKRTNNGGEKFLGVHKLRASGRFQAYGVSNNKKVHLGMFDSELEAHRAWQIYRLKTIEDVMEKGKIKDHLKLIEILHIKRNELVSDINQGKPTSY